MKANWLKKQLFLPRFFRDFHKQKDFFKCLFGTWITDENKLVGLDCINAHIFVIDYFLRFMAIHGYTLQKSRTKLEFLDIEQTIEKYTEDQKKIFFDILKKEMDKNGKVS